MTVIDFDCDSQLRYPVQPSMPGGGACVATVEIDNPSAADYRVAGLEAKLRVDDTADIDFFDTFRYGSSPPIAAVTTISPRAKHRVYLIFNVEPPLHSAILTLHSRLGTTGVVTRVL